MSLGAGFRSLPKHWSICQPRAGRFTPENLTSYLVPLERREEISCLLAPYWVQDEQPRPGEVVPGTKGNLDSPDEDGDSLLPRALALGNEHGDASLLFKRRADLGNQPTYFETSYCMLSYPAQLQASFHSGYARRHGKRLFWEVDISSKHENQECCCPPPRWPNT